MAETRTKGGQVGTMAEDGRGVKAVSGGGSESAGQSAEGGGGGQSAEGGGGGEGGEGGGGLGTHWKP